MAPAPLLSPPIADGMTDTVDKLHSILLKSGPISRAELVKVPILLRRVRYLLQVYYDSVASSTKTQEFKFCDAQNVYELGTRLHHVGVFLQLNPSRLRALFKNAPDMENFLLNEPLDIGNQHRRAVTREETFLDDPEAYDDRLFDTDNLLGAAYHMAFFFGDLLIGLLFLNPLDNKEKEWVTKAMDRLVQMSTIQTHRDAFGDALTDAMRPVYRDPKLLLRFVQAGGLPALIGDWSMSCSSTEIDEKCLIQKLPEKAWENVSPDGLHAILHTLISRMDADGDEMLIKPVFTTIMHQIYSHHDLAPFNRASKLKVVYYFIYRRLSRRPDKARTVDDWVVLMTKFRNVPRARKQRHAWMLFSIKDRWDCLSDIHFGCSFGDCPKRAALLELKKRRVRGKGDLEVEGRLMRWGGQNNICKRCKYVSYCDEECQKADWKRHQPECNRESEKNLNEEF